MFLPNKNMCDCDPIIPLSEEAKKKSNVLKIMFFGYIVLLIALIATGELQSLFSFIIAMLLVLGAAFQANYQLCGLAVLFSFFNGFVSFLFLALRIQNAVLKIPEPFKEYKGLFVTVIIVHILSFIFHGLLIYFLFDAFKEFKAIYKSNSYSKLYNIKLFILLLLNLLYY